MAGGNGLRQSSEAGARFPGLFGFWSHALIIPNYIRIGSIVQWQQQCVSGRKSSASHLPARERWPTAW
jgi:hypothetical protein